MPIGEVDDASPDRLQRLSVAYAAWQQPQSLHQGHYRLLEFAPKRAGLQRGLPGLDLSPDVFEAIQETVLVVDGRIVGGRWQWSYR